MTRVRWAFGTMALSIVLSSGCSSTSPCTGSFFDRFRRPTEIPADCCGPIGCCGEGPILGGEMATMHPVPVAPGAVPAPAPGAVPAPMPTPVGQPSPGNSQGLQPMPTLAPVPRLQPHSQPTPYVPQ